MQKILITDTLFIFPEHEAKLRAAGFEIERLPKPEASEDELVEAIKGKSGYILGGVEHITDKVINAADELKAIAFTGADWASFIPGYEVAAKKGIKITNTPGNTTFAVSEFAITLLLGMLRHVFELGGTGDQTFMTTQSLNEVRVGIVGMGRIGERVTRLLLALGVREIYYWNRTRKLELEDELGIKYVDLEDLFVSCDVISNHLSSQAGTVMNKDLLDRMKAGMLIINTGGHDSFDMDALYEQIATNKARAAFDVGGGVKDERFKKLPISNWYSTNDNAAYNTRTALKLSSDMATESILNILTKGKDQYIVNG